MSFGLRKILIAAFALFALTLSVCAVPKDALAADELTGKTASEITDMMGIGWNLGNTFDATGGNSEDIYSHETSWGNPVVTKELIKAVKAEGFNTIRIPVTWYNYADGDFNIDSRYMDRVKEVVTWAYEEGFFIILNVHHENWVNDANIDKNYIEIGYKLSKVWSQIADNFAEFDQHLIFEGMNEPRASGTGIEWTGNDDCYHAVNYLLQVFANTVRSNDKGHNGERALMVPGYAAGSTLQIMNSITLPTVDGEVCNNLIVSVHCYSPYDFCLADTQKDFDVNNSSHTGGIDTLFSQIDDLFLSKGIPVVIGETSATAKNNVPARENWAAYMAKKSAVYGVPIVIWDNGSNSNSGGESHAHMNRAENKANYPTVFKALFDAYAASEKNSARGKSGSDDPGSSSDSGTVIWSENSGKKSTKSWDAGFITIGAKPAYYLEGREVVIEYSGSGDVKMILDSEVKQQWWIPIDPTKVVDGNGRKKAVFSHDTIMGEMAKFGITDPADLRNMCFITTTEDVTAYSVTVIGGGAVITFMSNGRTYSVSSEMPSDPEYKNMEFLGWYFTRDYQADSKYEGAQLESDSTVYGKFKVTDAAFPANTAKPADDETKPEDTSGEDKTSEDKTAENTGEDKTADESDNADKSDKSDKSDDKKSDATKADSTAKEGDKGNSNALLIIILAILAAAIVVATVIFIMKIRKMK